MRNTTKTFFGLIMFILGCLITSYVWGHLIYTAPKEIKIEVPQTPIINIQQTFDLTGVEYTKKVMTDVTVTSYNNHANQTDDTPNITSTLRPVREGIVAVSKDFLNNNWAKYGDLIYVDCFNKWYIIEDTMNPRFEKRIDIFLFDKQESLKIHKKCKIEIIHITK